MHTSVCDEIQHLLNYWGSLLPLYLARGLKKRSGCANDLYARSVAIDPPPNSGNGLWLQV